ncbi:hypothetical protein [Actinomadura harenae]|uniref:Uncharacterized protein n=1 Tax=Actinomadura harenae TaxID=2483351 RepID=A0A3M2LX69_9ACTN|nr:hypothetical protein [Actinomadura harenae]RMI39558.1 hypothetical protein EBO15_29300 [Actinomadura harenae]
MSGEKQEEARAALLREFPGWTIIQARDTGRWWATRGPEPGELIQEGPSVAEDDTPEGLRRQLRELGFGGG